MATEGMFLSFHGLMLPKETHDLESLKFAHDFTFKDNDVFAATYPKSGQVLLRLKQVAKCCISKIKSKHFDVVLSFVQKLYFRIPACCHFRFLSIGIYTCIS